MVLQSRGQGAVPGILCCYFPSYLCLICDFVTFLLQCFFRCLHKFIYDLFGQGFPVAMLFDSVSRYQQLQSLAHLTFTEEALVKFSMLSKFESHCTQIGG